MQEKSIKEIMDIQNDMKLIEKSKNSDKQSYIIQFNKLNNDIINNNIIIDNYNNEKMKYENIILNIQKENQNLIENNEKLKKELLDINNNKISNIYSLHDEIKQKEFITEQIRNDYNIIIKQYQTRQDNLEVENSELINSVTLQQKEIQKLQNLIDNNSNNNIDNINNNNYNNIQYELITLTEKYNLEIEKSEELNRKIQNLIYEKEKNEINNNEEKQRNQQIINNLTLKMNELENKLNNTKTIKIKNYSSNSGFLFSSSDNNNNIESSSEHHQEDNNNNTTTPIILEISQEEYDQMGRDLQEHRLQSQNLSKLLLKKQSTVLELQAERSALKSRLIDMQTR